MYFGHTFSILVCYIYDDYLLIYLFIYLSFYCIYSFAKRKVPKECTYSKTTVLFWPYTLYISISRMTETPPTKYWV